MTGIDPHRLAQGREMFIKVYGSDELLPPVGSMMPTDMMLAQAFAEVWSRPGLDIPTRRLLIIGALAALGEAVPLQIQFDRALAAGELKPDQLDEVALQLAHYLGWPKLGMLMGAASAATAAHRRRVSATDGDA